MGWQPIQPIPQQINETGQFRDLPYPDWAKADLMPGLTREALTRYRPAIDARIKAMYGWRYISLHPYDRWEAMFTARLQSQVARWAPALNALAAQDGLDISDGGDVGTKAKDINSKYPQGPLDPDKESYASEGDDHVRKQRTRKGQMAAFSDFDSRQTGYRDPVTAIVDSMGVMFSRLVY